MAAAGGAGASEQAKQYLPPEGCAESPEEYRRMLTHLSIFRNEDPEYMLKASEYRVQIFRDHVRECKEIGCGLLERDSFQIPLQQQDGPYPKLRKYYVAIARGFLNTHYYPVLRNERRFHAGWECSNVVSILDQLEAFLTAMKQIEWRTDTPRRLTSMQTPPAPTCTFSTKATRPEFVAMREMPNKGHDPKVRNSYACLHTAVKKVNGRHACMVHATLGRDLRIRGDRSAKDYYVRELKKVAKGQRDGATKYRKHYREKFRAKIVTRRHKAALSMSRAGIAPALVSLIVSRAEEHI